MNLSAEWQNAFNEAAEIEPIEAANVRQPNDLVRRSSHWIYRQGEVPRPGGQSTEHPPLLPAVWLQSRSSSVQDARPISFSQCAGLLLSLADVRESAADSAGREWQSRIYPSGGGAHPIEPLLHWSGRWFAAKRGIVVQVEIDNIAADKIVRAFAATGWNHTLSPMIFAIAEPELTEQRYPTGISILWRDAGAFAATAQFAAAALGLSSRILSPVVDLGADNGLHPYVLGGVVLIDEDS